jgi:hypothetical protein
MDQTGEETGETGAGSRVPGAAERMIVVLRGFMVGDEIFLSKAIRVAGRDLVRGINRVMRWSSTSFTELCIEMRWLTIA